MKKKNKIIIGISIFISILLIIPLIYIARYNHSCADDFSYGILTHKTWQETHSMIEVLKAALKQVHITYYDWQGTFSAIFLMALQPAIFGEQFYGITTIILIATFIISNMYMMKIILKEYLKCNGLIYWIITLMIITFSIQFMPCPVEGFYWYNGSIYYTFFYSIMLILIGTILKLLKTTDNKKKNIYFAICIILAFCIGGSNYTTALVTNIIISIFLLISLMKKDKKSIYIGIILLVCFIALMISVKSPGNEIRQEINNKMTEIDAILYSFKYASIYTIIWTKKSIVWFYIFLIPILLKIVKSLNYKFRMPLLFTIITVCVYVAQFTPPLYAQSGRIPYRLLNIIYFSMYWLIIMNLTYWLGYLNSKLNIVENKKNYICIYAIIIILGIITLSTEFKYMTSYRAIQSLHTGSAYQYDYEIKERIKLYEDENLKDIEVDRLNVKPYLLYFSDITENSEDWQNQSLAEFYNKNSVKLKENK